nr:uncharacterized protein LOC124815862 [Hydra vulgaris]
MSELSIVDPLTCGFAKVAVYIALTEKHKIKHLVNENYKVFRSRVLNHQYKTYIEKNPIFHFDYEQIKKKGPVIINHIKNLKGSRSKLYLKDILLTFSKERFNNLGSSKMLHSLFNCQGCITNKRLKKVLEKFPVKCKRFKYKAEKRGMYRQKKLSTATHKALIRLDQDFNKKYSTTFTKAMKINLPNPHNEKMKHRYDANKIKNDIENQWKETSTDRAFGVPVSLSNRDKLRLTHSFETQKNAKKRRILEISAIKNVSHVQTNELVKIRIV